MDQGNKEFELSGTLGSLNDAALNNLANSATNDTVTNNGQNLENQVVSQTTNNDIELLDVPVSKVDVVDEGNTSSAEANNFVITDKVDSISDSSLESSISLQPNMNPVSTNFDIGDIGSVPPMDPTGKTEKKSKKKKNILFAIIVVILIFAVGALVFYYLHISKGSIGNAVVTKDLSLEIGEDLPSDINEYATFKSISSSNCILDTNNVDTTKAGKYEYSITCGNRSYKGNIALTDSKAPEVKTKTIVKKVDEEITAEEFVSECNESTNCTYTFENSEQVLNNIKQAGSYEFNIIVKDANENSATVPVKMIVIDSDIKVYLNCVLSDQTEEGFNGVVSYVDKIGISPESQYVGIYFKITEYMASSEDEYNKIKTNYETNKVWDINNGEGTPVFDDTNLTISIEQPYSGESDFGTDYSSIKTHYETTKNYRCNLLNVN